LKKKVGNKEQLHLKIVSDWQTQQVDIFISSPKIIKKKSQQKIQNSRRTDSNPLFSKKLSKIPSPNQKPKPSNFLKTFKLTPII
jgi:hypothetical protein